MRIRVLQLEMSGRLVATLRVDRTEEETLGVDASDVVHAFRHLDRVAG